MTDPVPLTIQRLCANLRCSQPFQGKRKDAEFCCDACRVQWHNLVRASCLKAAELLIEHRMQPRESKKKRAEQIARARAAGKPLPPVAKKGLLTKAMKIVDDFIRDERAIKRDPTMIDAPRAWRFRD